MKMMKKLILFSYALLIGISVQAQVSVNPTLPKASESITITYDATGTPLAGVSTLKIHTGVIIDGPSGTAWQHVIGDWGDPDSPGTMTNTSGNLWEITFVPRDYYAPAGLPSSQTIYRLGMVFREGGPCGGFGGVSTACLEGKDNGGDFFIDISPDDSEVRFITPIAEFFLADASEVLDIDVRTGAVVNTINLYQDGILQSTISNSDSLVTTLTASASSGEYEVVAEAIGTETTRDTFNYLVVPATVMEDVPSGLKNGVNYINNDSVVLVLHGGDKERVFAFGEFSDWDLKLQYLAKKGSDDRFWVPVGGLTSGQEYAYQYYIDEGIIVADPYSEKVLNPDDQYISDVTYPGLKPYPTGNATGYVSVLQTNQTPYVWQTTGYTRPASEDLVIYELLARDFSENDDYQTVIDSLDYLAGLGINAIQFMPIMEFQGNDSWGYNPTFFMALDKAYGTKDKFKELVDACHARGIAVILDIALNHAHESFPYCWMWFDTNGTFAPAADNPYFNVTAKHPFNVFFDFNHESDLTKQYLDDVNKYWLEEYNIDGYRFDLSKGFTQRQSSDVGAWNAYDQGRVDILTRMYNEIRNVDATAYVILEHLGDNSEETVLANLGMMPWGIMHSQFKDNVLGFAGNTDVSGLYHENRGWNFPNLVGYMESHDEERLIVDAVNAGNSNGSYNVRELNTALQRKAAANAIMYAVPGPKMLWQFGELGYDFSINYCTDGSINPDCRVGRKPVRWDYAAVSERRVLYKQMAEVIKLKTEYGLFSNSRIDNIGGSQLGADLAKIVKITPNNYTANPTSASESNVIILANLDMVSRTFNPIFHHTGNWYDHFSGQAMNVTDINMGITLEPGAFIVYTDYDLPDVDPEVSTQPLATPTNLVAALGTAELTVDLTWTDNSTEVSFAVERKIGTGDFTRIATLSANTTSYQDTDPTAGELATYRIVAISGVITSNPSNESAVTPALNAPSGLAATAVADLVISIAWTDNSSKEDGFRIERKLSTGAFQELTTVSANTTSYSDTDASLTTASQYVYRVRAYKGSGNSIYATETGNTTPGKLAVPTSLSIEITGNTGLTQRLSWTDNSAKEDAYVIERKSGTTGAFTVVETINADREFYTDDSSLPFQVEYFYRVKATKGSTDESDYSSEASKGSVLSTSNETLARSIDLYPNPAGATLRLEMDNNITGQMSITISDLVGKSIQQIQISKKGNNLQQAIDLKTLPAGIYILKVETAEGYAAKRFVKE